VISVEAAPVNIAIHLDYFTSEVALEEPEIGSTVPNIPIDNNCTEYELHFGMTGDSGDYEDKGDKSDQRDAIPTASQRRRATTELERLDQGTSDVNGHEGEDGNDTDEEKDASRADVRSTQNMDDRGHSRTSNVGGYDRVDGDNADEKEGAS